MVSKKILGVAIAAAMSSPAFAVIDLTGGTNGAGSGAVLYAKETITNAVGQFNNGMVQATEATTELDVQVGVGFGVTATSHAFVRINLTNAKFKTTIVPADLTAIDGPSAGVANISNVVVAQGGQAGDDYVIFDVTSGGLAQDDKFQLDLDGLQLSPTAAATLSYAHYSTSPNAVAQTGALASDSYAFASVANALTTTITATDRVADVSTATPFTAFVSPASATASIGNIKFELASNAITAVGATVNSLAQVMDTTAGKSQLVLTGDLSFIAAPAGAGAAAAVAANLTFGGVNADVGTPATNTASTGKLTTLSGLALAGAGNDVALTATGAINPGSYSLTFTPTSITNAQFGATGATGALGTITRSGTTIQVPYLSTNPTVNQKLILVNRGSSDVPYSITFTKEAGVTATAGAAATGTLKAKETKVLKASDVVTIASGSRTAATVVVTAPNSTIDAATQTVITDTTSVSYGSVDTVVLKN